MCSVHSHAVDLKAEHQVLLGVALLVVILMLVVLAVLAVLAMLAVPAPVVLPEEQERADLHV